jgi:nitrate/TMAO reductase-like tetraheme cytochrome c subunit
VKNDDEKTGGPQRGLGWLRAMSRERLAWILAIGMIIGIAVVVVANKGIQVAGTNEFCARACHTMKPAAEA